jgi:hypothetical protein
MNKIDEIIASAYKDLDRFYENYGEYKEKPKTKSTRKKILFDQGTSEEQLLHTQLKKAPPSPVPVNYPVYSTTYKAMIPKPKKKLSLNIKGLSSREIVDLIKKETGEAITICLKSKQNVIRHAKIILKKKGMRLYG